MRKHFLKHKVDLFELEILLPMKNVKAIATAFTSTFLLLISPNIAVAQEASIDQLYLDFLHNSLQEQNQLAYVMATEELTSEENTGLAQTFCAALSDGYTVESFLSEISATPGWNALSMEEQLAVASYWSVSVYGSTLYYCPEHQAAVEQFYSSAN
jgi:hypothetical protein